MADLALDEDSRAVIERLVAEKQRLLEQSAPRLSLQPYLDGEAGAADAVMQQLRSLPNSPMRSPPAGSLLAGGFDAAGLCGHGERTAAPARKPPQAPRASASPQSVRLPAHALQRAERVAAEARARERAECTFRPAIRAYIAPPPPPPPRPASADASSRGRRASGERSSSERMAGSGTGASGTGGSGTGGGVGEFDGDGFFERNQAWHRERERERLARVAAAEAAHMAACPFRPEMSPRRASSSIHRERGKEGAGYDSGGPLAGAPVHERLYQPDARARYLEEQEGKRLAAEEAKERECTFHPQLRAPSRSNAAVACVPSRWKSTPSKADRIKAAEAALAAEEAKAAEVARVGRGRRNSGPVRSFSPRVNALPRRMSDAAAEYLTEPAHVRLSRAPPPPQPRAPTPASARPLRHSVSAPQHRTHYGRGGSGVGGSGVGGVYGGGDGAAAGGRRAGWEDAARAGGGADVGGGGADMGLGRGGDVGAGCVSAGAAEAFASFLQRQEEYARRRNDARVRAPGGRGGGD